MQSRINELTTRDDHATIYQVGEVGALRRVAEESANIADQMQEVYEIVDADVENFVHPPEEIKAIYGPSGEGCSTLKATNIEPLLMDIEPERSPHHTGRSLYMVDENQLNRVENTPEARA